MDSSEPGGRGDAMRVVRAAVAAGRLPPTWLLVGDDGIGKRAFAEWMVRLRWCRAESGQPCGSCPSCRQVATGNHPDVAVVRRDPSADQDPLGLGSRHEITVGQVRELVLAGLALRSVEGHGRSVIIEGAEDLNVESQNALLKVLEEPPPQSLIVLVASHEEVLLDTVRSRCHELRLAPLDEGEMSSFAADVPDALRRLARGRPGRLPDLRRLDVAGLLDAFDRLLAGRCSGAAFARAAESAVGGGVEQGGDEASLRRLAIDLLHDRLREHLLAASGGSVAGLADAAWDAETTSNAVVSAWERALMEAQADLRRHLPASVSWTALGFEFEVARMGG